MTGTLTNTLILASGSVILVDPGSRNRAMARRRSTYFAVLASGTFTANSGSAVTGTPTPASPPSIDHRVHAEDRRRHS